MSLVRYLYTSAIALALFGCALVAPRTVGAHNTAQRAGTLTAAFSSDFSTMDPAQGYDPFSWTGEHAIYDTLLEYNNAPGVAGTKLVPGIASALPRVSFQGRWYTFRLRHNVRFSPPVNRIVTASDVKYSIERSLAKSTRGPMFESGFFSPLAGSAAFWHGKSKHIRGIRVLNRFAIQFRLNSPDLAFEDVLTLPFSAVIPREWVARVGSKNFSNHPIGTGPYMVQSWQHGRRMFLERNPNYFRPGFPRVPTVDIQFGVGPHLQILRAEKGELDLPGDEVTGTDYLALRRGQYAKQLAAVRDIGVWYLSMNMKMAPFKGNLNLRRAFNMAIDKGFIYRLLNGRAILMNGILPPTMPGANKRFTYYKYNPARARVLLRKAGYRPGQLSLTMLYISNPDEDKVADRIVSDLGKIGVKLTLKPVNANIAYNEIYTPGKVPFALFHWGQDYPDPSDFIDPILTCTAQNNAAFYCNGRVDRLAARARADTNVPHRYATYRKIERLIMSQAPWVPLWDDIFYDFHGSRVRNFFVHPVWPFVYDQYRL